MHLQQTKAESRATGGPQYYFHDLNEPVKDFLRRRGACPVVLQTPYGIVASPFMAVDRDHKLTPSGRIIPGKVGHDRIQQAGGNQSIGEAIRHWYGLEGGRDFVRIDVEASIHPQGHFILIPIAVKMRGRGRVRVLERVAAPLSFHRDHQSKFWRTQIEAVRSRAESDFRWAAEQITRLVGEHTGAQASSIHEADLLRAAGPLALLGLALSPYLVTGYDCPASKFRFGDLPEYPCPVEIKKRSKGFKYQIARYTVLPRVVVLCMRHDLINPPDHVDIIEMTTLAAYLSR